MKKTVIILWAILFMPACTIIDHPVSVVNNFTLDTYLGNWYEIARLDHSFERGLSHVTANYSLRDDEGIRVINRGYDLNSQTWKEAEGKAYFMDKPNIGRLKVSFFGPFYGAYQINELVTNAQDIPIAALIIGPNTQYAWILARDKQISEKTKQHFIQKLAVLTIPYRELIWVNHSEISVP